jgi:hypothetical protein
MAVAYIRKVGENFIAWTDVGGEYQPETRTLPDGRTLPVFALVGSPGEPAFSADRRSSCCWMCSTLSTTRPYYLGAGAPLSNAAAVGCMDIVQLLILDMRLACAHAYHMSKMIQIRNVPDALHRKLKVRAAGSGQTLSDYLLAELERLAARPTRHEMVTRLHSRKRVTLKTPAAVVIREERESA